ncbi:MAG: hypothetical protein ACM3MK_01255 [Chitinophagales bacterium]
MSRREVEGATVKRELQDVNLHDDFALDEFEEENEVTIYDVDNVMGYTVDIFKVGFPFLFLVALFLGIIFLVGMYL